MDMKQVLLVGEQYRIKAEICPYVKKVLQVMITNKLSTTRELIDFVGPSYDELLVDPVAIVQHPFSIQAGIDAKPTPQPIKSFQQTPM